ncbi:MAG: UvrD-helicase domain-containing protein [Eggerthellaceae bacterium]|nr:UvrD-helicase domain-containing protein [Eggerthellaceae bacterium]
MDAVFEEEQQHLTWAFGKLEEIERDVRAEIERTLADALADKEDLFDEMTRDFARDIQLETLAELEAMNRIIESYNLTADINEEKLRRAQLLMRRPYFAKVRLKLNHADEPKDIYIGAAGMTDEKRRHFIVDWRSPVAEVYYNQENGATSYDANGRTIEVDLQLRRQFDIERDRLNSYFDTTVAIEDPLLLASLAKRRTAQLQAITTTIQKEQNRVIRHADVPALLVHGIAGSGKTSVLLQRIAYLFYTERDTLNPDQVFLLTPNPVFGRYIDNVLPDMGESNPHIMTWDALMETLGLTGRGVSRDADISVLRRIDELVPKLRLEANDFNDLRVEDERVIAAHSVRASMEKFAHLPMGTHRCTLAIEDLKDKLEQRIMRLSKDEETQERVMDLPDDEQIRLFGQQLAPLDEAEVASYTRQWLVKRYAPIAEAIEEGAWLRLDRIGMRMLGTETLDAVEWLYLKLALVGGGARDARYVMVDEVQDYTTTQLAVLARYFSNANFLLLGDENQAVNAGTATFAEIRDLFRDLRGSVDECALMISYRSSPEITELFSKLLPDDERLEASSVQRPGTEPEIIECDGDAAYDEALRAAVRTAAEEESLCALIANSRTRAKQLAKLLEGEAIATVPQDSTLPSSGVVLLDVKLAKGLEFDHVIVPDVQEGAFPDEPLRRHRLYTAISRATQRVTLLANGKLANVLR